MLISFAAWSPGFEKIGRVVLAVAYVDPRQPVSAEEVDTLNDQWMALCRDRYGNVRTEVVISAKSVLRPRWGANPAGAARPGEA